MVLQLCKSCGELVEGAKRCRCGSSSRSFTNLVSYATEPGARDGVDRWERKYALPSSPSSSTLTHNHASSSTLQPPPSSAFFNLEASSRSPTPSISLSPDDDGIPSLTKVHGTLLSSSGPPLACCSCSRPFPPDATLYPSVSTSSASISSSSPSYSRSSSPSGSTDKTAYKCLSCFKAEDSLGACFACSRPVLPVKDLSRAKGGNGIGFVRGREGRLWCSSGRDGCFRCTTCDSSLFPSGTSPPLLTPLTNLPTCEPCLFAPPPSSSFSSSSSARRTSFRPFQTTSHSPSQSYSASTSRTLGSSSTPADRGSRSRGSFESQRGGSFDQPTRSFERVSPRGSFDSNTDREAERRKESDAATVRELKGRLGIKETPALPSSASTRTGGGGEGGGGAASNRPTPAISVRKPSDSSSRPSPSSPAAATTTPSSSSSITQDHRTSSPPSASSSIVYPPGYTEPRPSSSPSPSPHPPAPSLPPPDLSTLCSTCSHPLSSPPPSLGSTIPAPHPYLPSSTHPTSFLTITLPFDPPTTHHASCLLCLYCQRPFVLPDDPLMGGEGGGGGVGKMVVLPGSHGRDGVVHVDCAMKTRASGRSPSAASAAASSTTMAQSPRLSQSTNNAHPPTQRAVFPSSSSPVTTTPIHNTSNRPTPRSLSTSFSSLSLSSPPPSATSRSISPSTSAAATSSYTHQPSLLSKSTSSTSFSSASSPSSASLSSPKFTFPSSSFGGGSESRSVHARGRASLGGALPDGKGSAGGRARKLSILERAGVGASGAGKR